MFNKDLIAKYGESTGIGVREKELREALKFRRIAYSFFGLAGVVVLGVIYMIDPMGPVWLLCLAAAVGALFGLIGVVMWIFDNWPTMMNRIHNAKNHGVLEDKR